MKSYRQMQQEIIEWQQTLKPSDQILIASVSWNKNRTTTLKAVVDKITDKQIKVVTYKDSTRTERKFHRYTMGEIQGVSGINDFICLYPIDTDFSVWADAKNYMFSFPGIQWAEVPLESLQEISKILDQSKQPWSYRDV